MDKATKEAIDKMTVQEMLRLHRFAPAGDLRFQGEEGDYRMARLAELRSEDPAAYTAASKNIGW
jgi:hypothetical protein